MRRIALVSLSILVLAAPAFAQMADSASAMASPITAGTRSTSDMVKGYVTKAADQMPENLYAFRPTPDVRTFGQLVGHIADANYMICAAAAGEKAPVTGIEKSKTSKSDLTSALAASYAYCDKILAETTDANGSTMEKVEEMGTEMPRLTLLSFNMSHNFEHYGNMVTYMRINKMVPPSSQGNMGR